MTRRYSCRYPVRHYELDFYHHVNNAVFVQHLQQAAIEAADDAGFGRSWCRDRGTMWVMRRLTIRYLMAVTYPDTVGITTWISSARGARCTRESEVRRESDGQLAVRCRAEWVLLDRAGGQPVRIPSETVAAFDLPENEPEDLGVRLRKAQATPDTHRYRTRRRVQHYELDTAGHVNHAAYVNWVGQAYFDALAAAGHPIDPTRRADWMVWQGGHDMEYLAAARADDPVEIFSWVCEAARVRGAWTHEVRQADTGQLLARDYSLGVFVDREGRPTTPPEEFVEGILRGPAPTL